MSEKERQKRHMNEINRKERENERDSGKLTWWSCARVVKVARETLTVDGMRLDRKKERGKARV